MNDQHPSLRFDHREIAVIFSLFVFVSLLMFTVGILVGKGLAQAKYEALLHGDRALAVHPADTKHPAAKPEHATEEHQETAPVGHGEEAHPASEPSAEAPAEPADKHAETKKAEAIELVPARTPGSDGYTGSLKEPTKDPEAEGLMKNPRIRSLVEDAEPAPKRAAASIPHKAGNALKAPGKSLPQGKYTVQIGSYPTEKDAAERVETLKKLGFQYAYFSAKELGEKKDTWYRVWLGYYSDFESAQGAGKLLQERGEVKNYLVRKTDTSN